MFIQKKTPQKMENIDEKNIAESGVDEKGQKDQKENDVVIIEDTPKPQGFRKSSPNFGMVNVGPANTVPIMCNTRNKKQWEIAEEKNTEEKNGFCKEKNPPLDPENIGSYIIEAGIIFESLDKLCNISVLPQSLHKSYGHRPHVESMLHTANKHEFGPIIRWICTIVKDISPVIISAIITKKIDNIVIENLYSKEIGEKIYKTWTENNCSLSVLFSSLDENQRNVFVSWARTILVTNKIDVLAELSGPILPELILDVATQYVPPVAKAKVEAVNPALAAQINAVARREERRALQVEEMKRVTEKNRDFLARLEQSKQMPPILARGGGMRISSQNSQQLPQGNVRSLEELVKINVS